MITPPLIGFHADLPKGHGLEQNIRFVLFVELDQFLVAFKLFDDGANVAERDPGNLVHLPVRDTRVDQTLDHGFLRF